jgi:GR25 family glycosyltransferase involved in LPS biosynthesis
MIPIYIINRADRPDRLTDIRQQLAFQELNGHRFEAIEGGWRGCRDSHLALLEKCKKDVSFLILEDDSLFVEDINPYLQLALEQLPKNYDMLMLGGSPQQPQERYSDNLFKARNVKTTHSILWHTRFNGAVEWILSHKDFTTNAKWDDFLIEWIQSCFNCFMTYPLICTQRQTRSDIAKRSDVSTIVKNFNKYCK